MKLIYKPDNERLEWSTAVWEDQEGRPDEGTELPEGYTNVAPPTPAWKLWFDWEKNEWVETAEWYEKEGYKTEEEAHEGKAQQHLEELQAEQEAEREKAEKQLLNLLVEQYLLSAELSEDQKAQFTALFQVWAPGEELTAGEKVTYNGMVYEVIQAHTTQMDWLPNLVPALYKVFYQRQTEEDGEPVEVIPEWVQPTGGHDAYNQGDRVTYKGTVYESKINGNVWSPEAHPAGWKEVTPS